MNDEKKSGEENCTYVIEIITTVLILFIVIGWLVGWRFRVSISIVLRKTQSTFYAFN